MALAFRLSALGFVLCATIAIARADVGEVIFTATSANVSQPGSPVSIRILRWSTDQERAPLIAALNPAPPPAAPAAAPAGERAAGAGLPAGAGSNAAAATGLPTGAGSNAAAAVGRAGRGRGRGRGGRGDAAPLTPIAALTAALGRAPTVGYLWTSDVTGYSIKYAYHAALPDGSERIILATNRRLGAYTTAWNAPAAAPATDYEFTIVELRVNAKGTGEGKASLTTKVVVDNDAKTLALENYGATPAILQNVKR